MAIFRAGSGSYRRVQQLTLDPSNIPAFSTNKETFTPTGFTDVDTDCMVLVSGPSLESGVIIDGARITAANPTTLEIYFTNLTSGAINPASQTFNVLVL